MDTARTLQSRLDEVKDTITDGLYLELSDGLLSIYNTLKGDDGEDGTLRQQLEFVQNLMIVYRQECDRLDRALKRQTPKVEDSYEYAMLDLKYKRLQDKYDKLLKK